MQNLPTYRDQIAITNYLLQQLENGLSGRDEPECLFIYPQDRYHLGVLAPRQPSGNMLSQPDASAGANQDQDAFTVIDKIQKNQGKKSETKQTSISSSDEEESTSQIENQDGERLDREDLIHHRGTPTSMGFEFMIAEEDSHLSPRLNIQIEFAIYTRRFPTWEQQEIYLKVNDDQHTAVGRQTVQLGDRHVRHNVLINPFFVDLKESKQLRIEEPFIQPIKEVLEAEKHDRYVWRQITRLSAPASAFTSKESYERYLSNLTAEPDVPPLSAYLDIRTIKLSDGRVRVGVYVVNDTPMDENSVAANTSRYLFDMRLTCEVSQATILPIELASVAEDYQYDPRIWVVGQGCSGEFDLHNQIFWTASLAQYNQFRLTTIDEPSAPFAMLAANPIEVLTEIHSRMANYGNQWEEELSKYKNEEPSSFDFRTQNEYVACTNDLKAFRSEADRFKAGIEALISDPALLQAFQAMHRVFERVGQSRGITKWRLFQIGFIATQLPSLAIREGTIETDILNFADVLWFPTGGGKTEAYLGLICCALLYDRLRGKKTGITAWLRFPLRMLSVQQLQRAIKVIYETEQERLILFGSKASLSDPISLGYFVGQSSTPNMLSDAPWAGKWSMKELHRSQELRNQLRLIRNCPRCQEPAVEVEVDAKAYRIKHVCQSCKLDLNIYLSDDEVYRYLPSVLIGTVDKLPSVAWRDKFAHIWGGAKKLCPEHGYTSGEYCIVYGCKHLLKPIQLYDPSPSLQIQDELHLLREELGTFAGHYETLASLCQTRETLPPKVIAATATVEGLDRQTRHLYNLPARRFPSRGYQLGGSFYTQYATSSGANQIARRFLAFKSPYLRPPEASARVLEIIHRTIRSLYQMLDSEGPTVVAAEIGSMDATTNMEVSNLLDKYDTSLTYVGSKAHGSRIERVLRDEVSRRVLSAGTRNLEVSYLNGESSIDDIAGTIESLENEGNWDDESRLDAVVGTSVVSHGVDVDRFNLMVMAGMPGRTAEYIQASSRSGRKFVGIVIVALSPWLLREQSFYHRFVSYHYHMDHLVEPVPINRFSRFAANKTLPGILAGVLNAYFAPMHSTPLTKIKDLHRALYEAKLFTEEELQAKVKSAFGLDSDIHGSSLIGALNATVEKRFKTEIRRLRSPQSAEKVPDALTRKPMTSLRDIDEPVPFEPQEYTYPMLWWISK